ncbi:MAG: Ig-like domain-containing protein [Muricomes sp.]
MSLNSLDENTFEIGDYTYEITGSDTVKLIDYNPFAADGNVVVPGTVEYKGVTYRVTTIGQELEGWWNVTSFTISEGIEVIEKGAISRYANLTTLNLPSTLREVYGFKWLKNLNTVTLAVGNPYFTLSDGVLYNKDMTTLLLYPAKRDGQSFIIPRSVTTIGTFAFSGVQNLTSLDIPDTVVTLGDAAINGADGLGKATVGTGVRKFGMSNFVDCTNLEILTLKGQYIIEQASISSCPKLKKIVIDGTIQGYMPWAFTELPALEEYEVRNTGGLAWNARDGILFNGNRLSRYPANRAGDTYIVPDDVTDIVGMAFDHTQNLKKLILNPGVRLSSVVVNDPVIPIDIYLRDTQSVNFIDNAVTIFSLPAGSHVYVANQSVKNSLLSNPVVINGENGAGFVEIKTIPATAIQVDKPTLSLAAGEKRAIKVSRTPYYSTEGLLWGSSNEKVAKVDASGTITAVGTGTANITVKSGNCTAICKVTVTAPLKPLQSISLDKGEATVEKGNSLTLKVAYNPIDTTDTKAVQWSSSNSNVASISDKGVITAKSAGMTTITAKVGSYKSTCKVTVVIPLTGIQLNQKAVNMDLGKSFDLKVNYTPADTTDSKAVAWSSSNKAVATVSGNGIVTAKSGGTATITAKVGNHTALCQVNVKGQNQPNQPSNGSKDPKPEKTPVYYPDVPSGMWYYEPIQFVGQEKIMSGYSNGNFGPADNLSRGQFATIFYRMERSPEITFERVFQDVGAGSFYSLPAVWAKKAEVIKGYDNGNFGAVDNMTREQLATMMYRYAEYKGYNVNKRGDLYAYPDEARVSGFAKETMSWAVGIGLISGDQGKLNPQGASSRAVTAIIIQRFMKAY